MTSMFALLTIGGALAGTPAAALTPDSTAASGSARVVDGNRVPIYSLDVVARTIQAVSYRPRSGETHVDFQSTALLPGASGSASVVVQKGLVKIEAKLKELKPATGFGREYLTYVLWAISPEGRASNLGEVVVGNGEAKMNVTTNLQSFGLIVTAEPYFAVTQPSEMVVLENVVRDSTVGGFKVVEARYELLKKGQYAESNNREFEPLRSSRETPLDLDEARNAVRIARASGAERHAAESFAKAERLLQQAEGEFTRQGKTRSVSMNAREAVQTAEDARAIGVKRLEAERADEKRLEAQNAQLAAEQGQHDAEQGRLAAEQGRQEAETSAAAADCLRLESEERSRLETDAARKQVDVATAETERVRAEADRERTRLRTELREQLNLILETRESARGLIINMSDVLFDTDRANLKPEAREKLAKIAGILVSHPGLKLEVEGHTDSTGAHGHNQTLSEQRAESVHGYVVSQGVPADSVAARGFAETVPVANNMTSEGRQLNRRVEIVVSGEPILVVMHPTL